MTKDELKDEMKNRISMALKDPVLQQGFEIICKENTELKSIADFQTSSNMDRYFQLKRSKERISELEKEKENAELGKENEIFKKANEIIAQQRDDRDADISLLENRIAELKAQIEKMKCCGNCEHFDFNEPNYCHKGVYRERQYVCDKWKFGN